MQSASVRLTGNCLLRAISPVSSESWLGSPLGGQSGTQFVGVLEPCMSAWRIEKITEWPFVFCGGEIWSVEVPQNVAGSPRVPCLLCCFRPGLVLFLGNITNNIQCHVNDFYRMLGIEWLSLGHRAIRKTLTRLEQFGFKPPWCR